MAFSTIEDKRAIIRELEASGEGAPGDFKQLLDHLNSVQMDRRLRQMVRARLLNKLRHGSYSLAANYHRHMLTGEEHLVFAITKFMREAGGYCRTFEVHDEFGDRPRGGKERGYSHKTITTVLKKYFVGGHGKGYWSIDEDGDLLRRALLPMTYWGK